MAIRSKFRKLKCQWHVSFIDYSTLSSFSYCFYYSTLINARVAIYSRILKEFHVLNENFTSFFQLLYAIATLRLFINENSTVNAMYGVFLSSVFVITALKSWNWAFPGNTATPLIRPTATF